MTEEMPKIELEFTITNFEPTEPKKMDFGRVPVCSECGNSLMQWPESRGVPCCEDGKRITLRQYYKDVLHKEFSNEGWHFEDKTINNISDETNKMNLTNKDFKNE